VKEVIGLIGGGLFLLSWVVQAWETHKARQAVVSMLFFQIRLVASVLLWAEAWRVQSPGFLLVISGTMLLIFYNMYMIARQGNATADS